MKPSIYIAGAVASFAFFAPLQAEAARCPQGYLFRPSQNICQLKAQAPRHVRAKKATRSEARRARIEARKARIAAARAKRAPVVARETAPDVAAMARTPIWFDMQPSPFAAPFGRIVLPITNYDPVLASWASLRMWGD